jgi:large repetitive protein
MGRLVARSRAQVWRFLNAVAVISLLATVVAPALLPITASAASVTSAAFSGSSGTVTAGGTLYAKAAASLTLTVNTSVDTKCVEVTGAFSAQQSSTAKSTWSFNFTAPAGDGLQTVTAAASPNFNGQNNKCTGASGAGTASYVLDNTGPVVTANLSPATNGAGWNNSNVSITWTTTDAGSGVASGPSPATDSVTANAPGTVKTSTAADRLGNGGIGSVTVRLDKSNPSITGSASPAPNANGWNSTSVTISFSCSDLMSGVKSCSGPTALTGEGAGQAVTGTAVDIADNSATASVTANIDKTAPVLSGAPLGAPNGAGWYNGNVAVRWSCSDALSGIAGSCPADSTISSEGSSLSAAASVADKAGNTTSATSSPTVRIDKTAPVTTASAPSGWNNTNVSVTLSASDALSGVQSTFYKIDGGTQQTYGGPFTISAEGNHALAFWSTDVAGNVEAFSSVAVKIDKTPPTINDTHSPAANTAGWNNSNVQVTFTCADTLSGVASCTVPQTVSAEGRNQGVTGTATDSAGNTAADTTHVSIDKTPPTVAGSRTPVANAAGWNNTDVIVSFSCSDALSGVVACASPHTLSEGADQSASGAATDAAGNSATATVAGINIDKTPPVLTGAPTLGANASGWYNADVSVHWSCSDALSGVAGPCPADGTITGEGNAQSASAAISDQAGNTTSSTISVEIDRTPPSTTSSVPAPLASGWYAGAVTITLTATDALSGVGQSFYAIDGGATQPYAGAFSYDQGGPHTVNFWSVDRAGNAEDRTQALQTITVKIDNLPPVITGSRSPLANANGWNNSAVIASFSCSDAESGIGACSPLSTTFGSEGAAQHVTGTAQDIAGNSSTATVNDVNVDMTPPTIAGSVPAANVSGWYNADVTAHWVCNDSLSGLDVPCPADTTVTGEGSGLSATTGTVVDKAGNASAPGTVSGINIDRTPPTIAGAAAGSPDGNGWYQGDVTIHWTCGDPLSGVDFCPPDSVMTGEGSSLSASATARDHAGNSGSATVDHIMIDRTAPSTIASLPSGWTNHDALVTLGAADGLSGVAATYFSLDGAPAALGNELTIHDDGSHQLEYWSLDRAGNQEAHHLATVLVDQTAPTITYAASVEPNGGGWNNTDVTISFLCADATSGLASCTAPRTVTAEGAGQAASGVALDNATNSATTTAHVSIDKTPPAIQAVRTPVANANGWSNSVVSVQFTCSDALSGVGACPDPQLFGEGAGQSASGASADNAGNTASTGVANIDVDLTPPTISGAATSAPNPNGWYNTDVTVDWTCHDNLSGVEACTPDTVLHGEGAALNATGSALDRAGNSSPATVAGINIDRHAPVTIPALTTFSNDTISLSGDTTDWENQAVNVALAATDALSGVEQTYFRLDSGAQQQGQLIQISTEGSHRLAFWSTDKAGNVEPTRTITILIDLTKPAIAHLETPAPNAQGWSNASSVGVSFACSDELSGIAVCTGPQTVTSEGTSSVSGTAVDDARNENGDTATVKIDRTPPTIAGAPDRAANSDAWYHAPVTIGFTCKDSLSGIATCSPAQVLAGEGAGQSASGVATDNADNAVALTVSGINIDFTPPSIAGAPDSAANGDGWYNADVSVSFTCADALSGVAGCPASTVLHEGSQQSVTGTSTDIAGNVAAATVSQLNVDKTAPTITGAPDRDPNASGWSRSDVTVTFSCDDSLSGIAACAGPRTFSEGAAQTAGGNAADKAGNTSSAVVAPINVDDTAPNISGAPTSTPNGEGWYHTDVTVHWTCGDALSGVASCPADSIVNGDGGDLGVTGEAADKAGNSASAAISGLGIDTHAPVTSAAAPSGWVNHDATVTLTSSDAMSGVGTTLYTIDAGPQQLYSAPFTISAQGTHSVIFWSVDRADNVEHPHSLTVQIDKTAPQLSGAPTTFPNANGWNKQGVTIHWTCSDSGGSGISGSCPADIVLAGDGSGQTASASVSDNAGNVTSATTSPVNIDRTPPTVSINGIANAGSYTLGAVPSVTCSALDGLSGLAGPCTLTHAGGLSNGAGTFTYTASATDRAGNATSVVAVIHVGYRFDGFLQPINDTAHQVGLMTSQFKAGSTVPVKFQLKTADGRIVTPVTAPRWLLPLQEGPASAAPPMPPALGADSGTTYRWDAAGLQWIYNWPTPTSAGLWWGIGVALDDGSVYGVNAGLR